MSIAKPMTEPTTEPMTELMTGSISLPVDTPTSPAFWRHHLMLPAICFLLAVSFIELFHLDIALGQWLFRLEDGVDGWPLRNAWLTEKLIHVGGRNLVILLGVIVLSLLGLSYKKPALKAYRRGLAFLFMSVLTSVILVRLGKSWVHLDCPWHLKIFGGSADYFSLFSGQFDADSPGQCFPAGHSSGGYAWVALYFFALAYGPRFRWIGLGFGLLLGLTFGIAQQLRGAHFISHDVWTLTISWFSALAWYYALFLRRRQALSVSPALQTAS
ncbi:phosphatase PAP2 family protein [Shewanella sp. Isolate7]|uniref:phosphatase PAP2 family protein n=1 Tax=Shewanella sp. Isolate7 TaxID=2908528 RepID=UPI001EFD6678|nr:phosphatase PAP2 family protein [Shewanella sp. Isolate7]MCG9721231.1 phosphatase PAP2 family protein [Shewanella sp. Isolate7]